MTYMNSMLSKIGSEKILVECIQIYLLILVKVCLRNEVEIRNMVHFCLLFELKSHQPFVCSKLFWYFKILFSIILKDMVLYSKNK